jgi:acyl-CoA thioester hydrolase
MTTQIEFEHQWQVRFVDTDANGFAHFSSYVKMMEETEYAFLRSRGLSVVLKDERGLIGFPRISVELTIDSSLKFEDLATVRMKLVEIDGKQIVYGFRIENQNQGLVATGQFTVACCRFPTDQSHYAILIPDFVETALTGQPTLI